MTYIEALMVLRVVSLGTKCNTSGFWPAWDVTPEILDIFP